MAASIVSIEASYGSWKSPITADQMASKSIDFSFPRFFDGQLFWMEFRPSESARTVIVRSDDSGNQQTLTPEGFSAQTKAHEYGGCCYTLGNNSVFFVNAKDQRIYCQDLSCTESTKPLSPEFGGQSESYRFADLIFDENRQRIIAAELVDSLPRNVFHHQIRLALSGQSTIV